MNCLHAVYICVSVMLLKKTIRFCFWEKIIHAKERKIRHTCASDVFFPLHCAIFMSIIFFFSDFSFIFLCLCVKFLVDLALCRSQTSASLAKRFIFKFLKCCRPAFHLSVFFLVFYFIFSNNIFYLYTFLYY